MHPFDQDISVEPQKSFSCSGHISENWSINGVPNGGYIMAILANAMLQYSGMKSTPVITANFLNRCDPGDTGVEIERMSQSRQFDRFQARLLQNDQEKARVFGTFASEANECILESYEVSAPQIAELEECVAMPADQAKRFTTGNHLRVTILIVEPDDGRRALPGTNSVFFALASVDLQ